MGSAETLFEMASSIGITGPLLQIRRKLAYESCTSVAMCRPPNGSGEKRCQFKGIGSFADKLEKFKNSQVGNV
jgi:hypothetical protein